MFVSGGCNRMNPADFHQRKGYDSLRELKKEKYAYEEGLRRTAARDRVDSQDTEQCGSNSLESKGERKVQDLEDQA